MKLGFMGVLLVLIGAMTAAVAIAQDSGSPPAGGGPREDAVRDLLDYDGNVINPDEQLAKIAQDQLGGFGGFYFDENDASIASS